jgi:hypothetical protein
MKKIIPIATNFNESTAKVAAILLVAFLGIIGIYSARGLYADGSFFLFNILLQKSYYDFDKPRVFVQLITQTPVVLGIKLGVKEITTLIYLHSIGIIGIPIIIWCLALFQLIKSEHFWILLVAFSATYLSAGFFAIGEYNLTYALAAYCLSVLLIEKITLLDSALIIFAAIALTRSYEVMVLLGPALFLFSARRIISSVKNKNVLEMNILLILLFLFASATTVAAWSILFPRDPVNLAGAGDISHFIKNGYFIYLSIMISIYFTIQKAPRKLKHFFVLMAAGLVIYFISSREIWNSPSMNYGFRSMGGLILFFTFLVIFVEDKKLKMGGGELLQQKISTAHTGVISLMLFLSLALTQAIYSLEFSRWIKNFELAASKTSSWVHIDDLTPVDGFYSGFNWAWTNPSLSIILRGNNTGGILNSKHYTGWQPFTPESVYVSPIGFFQKTRDLFIVNIRI